MDEKNNKKVQYKIWKGDNNTKRIYYRFCWKK